MNVHNTLLRIQNHKTLSTSEMVDVMSDIMDGQWENEHIAAFLMGLSVRGETIDEITGAATVMREKALRIHAPENSVDCCGTGGDGLGTYNISTAVAIIVAACGVPVAKHGNRSASSKSGAADVLEALGVNLDIPQTFLEDALKRFNFAFLMAPRHHSAMRYVVPVRKTLGVRTIFNVLGPLSNPAQAKHQLIGVFDKDLVSPIAHVLQKLGAKSAWVVHGSDGLDEITITGETYCAKLMNGKIEECVLHPRDFGLQSCDIKDLIGGNADENAQALKDLLHGMPSAYRDIVVANASAVMMIAGKYSCLLEASQQVQNAVDSGEALKLLDDYIDFTNKHVGHSG